MSAKKVLISDPIEKVCVEILTAAGITVDCKSKLPKEELLRIIPEYNGLIVRSGTTVTADVIEAGTKLELIGRAGTGVDNIDLDAATKKGCIVMNTPGGNTISAAEHSCALLMSMARNVAPAHQSMQQGKWDRKGYTGVELEGKNLGVLGLGRVGREVAKRFQSFGMNVLGFDPMLPAEATRKLDIEPLSVDEIIKRSDFITIHVPLLDSTKNLLGERAFQMCKPSLRIVNCARGGIVDEDALVKAIDDGRVAGAALDVFLSEPPNFDHPMFKHPKITVTPHLGASTVEAQEKVAQEIAIAFVDAFKGANMQGVVNSSVAQASLRPHLRPWLELAGKLGALQAAMQVGSLKDVTITACGDLLREGGALDLLEAGIIKGLVGHFVQTPVNLVNAPVIARALGIKCVKQHTDSQSSPYTTLLTVAWTTDENSGTISGAVLGGKGRVVEVDGFYVEFTPRSDIMMLYNADRPGMLAQVSRVVAESGTNIESASLAQSAGKDSLTVFTLSSPLPDEARKTLLAMDSIHNVVIAKL